ncbi:pumilio homolog 23-like [Aristolochia californica]|uniref:pumilio homolog 23-like n=1 Tax=Aristolochia californica TaxID=171875 RepID=UPI0035DF927B
MTCFGSKALQSRKAKGVESAILEMNQMERVDYLSKQTRRKHGKNRRPKKEFDTPHGHGCKRSPSVKSAANFEKAQKASTHEKPQLRKRVDPETVKYFSDIANLFESGGIELEERSFICGNALEETKGKELELATDKIISHTLQTLLEGCDVDKLCGFLHSCAKVFPLIAVDKSGSHVAETALKSLAIHLQDKETHKIIEETLTKICQGIVLKPVDVMCSSYGSHVLRSLLCLCKGIPVDSLQDYHSSKTSTVLAERLKINFSHSGGNQLEHLQQAYPKLSKFLTEEILKCAEEDLSTMQVNKYSSFVLQVALKLLVGDDEGLSRAIHILLGSTEENLFKGKLADIAEVHKIMELLKDTAYSHLMEVILEVSPEALYNEILTKIFKGSLFEISSHPCGSFVVQALVSSAKCQGQVELIWEELGPKMKKLLELGKSGVVASLLAACQRLHILEQKACQSLVASVSSGSDSSIVPRILFLERYFGCTDKDSWKWAEGDKMHTLGCLMLQTICRCSSDMIQPYIASVTAMESEHIFEMAKDAGGGRVLEAFLSSDASVKQKQNVIVKLRGHFGELSMHPSGSFTVEKCFTSAKLSHKEIIVSELVNVQAELSKTKHGPYLFKKLDVDGFVKRPEQWKSRQTSKQMVYKEFLSAFGSQKKSEESIHAAAPSSASSKANLKQIRKEINQSLLNPTSNFGYPSWNHQMRGKAASVTAAKDFNSGKVSKSSSFVSFISRKPKGKSFLGTDVDSQRAENTGSKSKKRHKQNDGSSSPFLKKQRR